MKVMRETCQETRELASAWRLQNGEQNHSEALGETWVPVMKMRYQGWCWFHKAVAHLALDVVWLRC